MAQSLTTVRREDRLTKGSKSELTRQRLLDAAAKIFSQKGYAHTRLSDIATEAQARAGGIYYYFASREVLVEELLATATKDTIDLVNERIALLPIGASAADKIEAAISGQMTAIMSKEGYAAAYFKIYPQVPETIRTSHRRVLRQFFDLWRRLIRDGQESGELRNDIDPAILRLVIIGSIQWSAEWAEGSKSSPDKLAEQMTRIFLGGILNPTRISD